MDPKIENTSPVTLGRGDFVQRFGLWGVAEREIARAVETELVENDIEVVRVVFPDTHGLSRGKTITTSDFLQTLRHGLSITNALLAMDSANNIMMPVFSADGGFGIPEMGGCADMICIPDLSTFRILPWADRTAWVLSDPYLTNGQPVPFGCRYLYKRALVPLAERGFEFVVGLEVEFYVFHLRDPKLGLADSTQPPTPPDVEALSHGYQYMLESHMDEAAPVFDALRADLKALGLPVRTMEDEWGPGQCEITFDPAVGVDAADRMLLFRSATKQICRRNGYLASFMCKPGLPNIYSSGWHLHQSLRAIDTGKNVFPHPDGSDLVSETARHYVGGLIKHASALTAFSNPTINAYKRINANPLAPNRALWAHDNKGAYIRVVGGGTEPITHIENRSGEPAANPYLFMASQVIAGLDGINNKIDPGEPCSDPYAQTDKPALPTYLGEAVDALAGSELFRSAFGDAYIDYYVNMKRHEIGRFNAHVSNWEHREYFEAF